jgi:hypothetical protein
MNRLLLLFACAAAIAPSAASASLTLQIGPNQRPDQVDAVVAPGSGEHFFDLTFTETPPTYNEYLVAYDLLLRTPQPGIRLLRMETSDNWVLPASDSTFVQREADAGHILVEAAYTSGTGNDHGIDITTGAKAGRVFYAVDPGTAPGLYPIRFDPGPTVFGSGDPNFPGNLIYADLSDVGLVQVTPEPTALALLAVAGVVALRRNCPRLFE